MSRPLDDDDPTPVGPLEIDDSDFGSGGTKAYYLPNEPRSPALPTPPPPMQPAIAELFQAMLRQAFAAGFAASRSGEAFETWYQREVLR